MGLAGGHCGRGAAELVAQVSAERVERAGGLLVHHPGPPPLGKRLIVSKVDAPGRYVSNEEAELLGPPVLDAAWWAEWAEYSRPRTTPAPCDVCNGIDPDCAACELAQVESPCNDSSARQAQDPVRKEAQA